MTFDSKPVRDALDVLEQEHTADVVAAVKAATDPLLAEVADLKHQIAVLQNAAPGIRWGSSLERRPKAGGGTETSMEALARLQSTFGPIDRIRYYGPVDAYPAWPIVATSPAATQLTEAAMAGIELDISFKPPLADVVAGKVDPAIDALCAKADAWFKRTGQRTRICMWHEADVKIRKGVFTLAQYRAAADHFNARVKAYGSAGLETACNFTKFTLMANNGLNFADLLPSNTDVHAWDVYKVDPKTTVAGMFDPIRAAAQKYGKPWCVWESAVDAATHTPAERTAALVEVARNIKTGVPAPVSFDYFNSNPGGPPPKWSIDDDVTAVAALKAGRLG